MDFSAFEFFFIYGAAYALVAWLAVGIIFVFQEDTVSLQNIVAFFLGVIPIVCFAPIILVFAIICFFAWFFCDCKQLVLLNNTKRNELRRAKKALAKKMVNDPNFDPLDYLKKQNRHE